MLAATFISFLRCELGGSLHGVPKALWHFSHEHSLLGSICGPLKSGSPWLPTQSVCELSYTKVILVTPYP